MSTNHFARFRYNIMERWLPLVFLMLCIIAVISFIKYSIWIILILLVIISYLIYRLLCVWAFHFIVFEETGVIVRRGLFFLPQHFRFDQITNIRTIEPDKHIHFQINSCHEIKISLCRLKKEDRIRFIFLIESDVNRLSINGTHKRN